MLLFNTTKGLSRRLIQPVRCVSSSISSGQSAQAFHSSDPRYGCTVDGCDSNAPIRFYRRTGNLRKTKYDDLLNAQIGRELAAADFYMALAYKFRHHNLARYTILTIRTKWCLLDQILPHWWMPSALKNVIMRKWSPTSRLAEWAKSNLFHMQP